MDWNSIIPAIGTLIAVVIGFIWQTAYFKGKFTEKIANQSISLEKIDKRLEDGQKTFIDIRQSVSTMSSLMATVTTSLTFALTELKELKLDTKELQKESQTKDTCKVLMERERIS